MFSRTALGLPGSVITSVLPTVPATGRESAASGVCCSDVESRRCTSPEAGRSMIENIAYGRIDHQILHRLGGWRNRCSGSPLVFGLALQSLSHQW